MRRTKLLLPLTCAMILLTGSSCAPAPKAPSEPASLQHVYYHRTGGFAGVDDRVEVQPDGKVGIVKRGERAHEYQLSRDQSRILRDAFIGWSSLLTEYPASNNARDDYRYEVRYGGRTIRASDAAADLPERLRNVLLTIEAIAQQS